MKQNEKNETVELPNLDINESKMEIQKAVMNGDIPVLNEAEAIYNYGKFWSNLCHQFKDEKPYLASACRKFEYISPEQRKRLLVVKTDDSEFVKQLRELTLNDQGGQYQEGGEDAVERATLALKDAGMSKSEKNLYAVSVAFENPGLHPSVVAKMAEDMKPQGKSMEDRVRSRVSTVSVPVEE